MNPFKSRQQKPPPARNVANFPMWGQPEDIGRELEGAANWEHEVIKRGRKYLMAKSVEGESLARAPPYLVEEAFMHVGEVEKIVRRENGSILITAKTAQQAEELKKITKIGNMTVKIEEYGAWNQCKALVRDEYMIYWDKKELLEKLASQGVVEIENIKKKRTPIQNRTANVQGSENQEEMEATPLFLLTFNTPERPSHIKVGYLNLPTREFIPNPLRCFKCQKFGHKGSGCRGIARCLRCGEPGHSEKCIGPIKCANCGNGHFASSTQCPIYQEEMIIQRISVRERITHRMAKYMYLEQKNAKSYSNTTANDMTSHVQEPEHSVNSINREQNGKTDHNDNQGAMQTSERIDLVREEDEEEQNESMETLNPEDARTDTEEQDIEREDKTDNTDPNISNSSEFEGFATSEEYLDNTLEKETEEQPRSAKQQGVTTRNAAKAKKEVKKTSGNRVKKITKKK